MKKILTIFIISQLFICCKNEEKNPVLGNWSFLIANGYNCYTCPKIEFGVNGKGDLIISASKKFEFTYKILDNNKIKFDLSRGETQSLFKQSEIFYYENLISDDFEQFDLISTKDREIIHTLIRQVPKSE